MNALEVKNICKSRGKFKLDNISLTLPAGCVMGLIGENGAGKSTLIKLITGIIHADSGTVNVLGTDNTSREFIRTKQDIGIVLDTPCFPPHFTVTDINKIMKHMYMNWDESIFFKCLGTFPKTIQYCNWSKGMKALMPIAAALAHDARLLILDEATSGLDPVVRDEVLDIINDFTRDENRSVLISSHILSDLEKICDYIAYISHGKLVFCEEKDAMLDKLAIVKCSDAELDRLDASKVIGRKSTGFGAEALIYRDAVPDGMTTQKASIEDIMIYTRKGDTQ